MPWGLPGIALSLLVSLRHPRPPRAGEDTEEPGEHPQRLPPAREVTLPPPHPRGPYSPLCRIRTRFQSCPWGRVGRGGARRFCLWNSSLSLAPVPQGRWAGSGDSLGCHSWGWARAVLLASGRQGPGMPLSTLSAQHTPTATRLRHRLRPGRLEGSGPFLNPQDWSPFLWSGDKGWRTLRCWALLSEQGTASTFLGRWDAARQLTLGPPRGQGCCMGWGHPRRHGP